MLSGDFARNRISREEGYGYNPGIHKKTKESLDLSFFQTLGEILAIASPFSKVRIGLMKGKY